MQSHVIHKSYRFDMVLKDFRDSLRVFGILFRDDGQVADFVSIVDLEVF